MTGAHFQTHLFEANVFNGFPFGPNEHTARTHGIPSKTNPSVTLEKAKTNKYIMQMFGNEYRFC